MVQKIVGTHGSCVRHMVLNYLMIMVIILAGCSSQTKESEEKEQTAKVKSDETNKIAEVTVMELQPTVFSHEIVSNGRLAAKEKVDVNFQTSGLISAIYVKNGQHVSKGQKIASLDSYKLQNQLAKDRNAARTDRNSVGRSKEV